MGDGVTTYTLSEASKAAGRSKSTILRSIRSGRVSASRDELTGGWNINAAELHRVYDGTCRDAPDGVPGNGTDAGVLQAKLQAAEARLLDKDQVIDDLRRRLDAEAEERRRLTTLLTVRRRWWPWSRPVS